jgi:hypothetical protein
VQVYYSHLFVMQAKRTALATLAVQKEKGPETDIDVRWSAHRYPFPVYEGHHCLAFQGEVARGDGRMDGCGDTFGRNWNTAVFMFTRELRVLSTNV